MIVCSHLAGAAGIEPALTVLEAAVLPLNDAPVAPVTGIEPSLT